MKFSRTESIRGALERLEHDCRQKWLHTLHEKLCTLDPTDPETLPLVLSSLIKRDFEQKEIADLLKTSRVQVKRWTDGKNTPKQSGYRVWLIERLLAFLKEQAEKPARPLLLRRRADLKVVSR